MEGEPREETKPWDEMQWSLIRNFCSLLQGYPNRSSVYQGLSTFWAWYQCSLIQSMSRTPFRRNPTFVVSILGADMTLGSAWAKRHSLVLRKLGADTHSRCSTTADNSSLSNDLSFAWVRFDRSRGQNYETIFFWRQIIHRMFRKARAACYNGFSK